MTTSKIKIWLLAALLGVAGGVLAQSHLPACSWIGVKNNCTGEIRLRNGEKYAGEIKNDRPHGQGTLTHSDAYIYVGEFRDGSYHGRGKLTLVGGYEYIGDFKSGRFDGQGSFKSPDGRVYVGEFRDDNFNGRGTLTFADGRKYVGEFKDDQLHGRGAEYRADGALLQAGVWVRDEFVGAADPAAQVAASSAHPAEHAAEIVTPDMQPQRVATTVGTDTNANRSPAAPDIVRLKARALVIGNGAYANFGRLPNPRSDAQAIAAKFRSFGIEVDLVLDADRDTLVRALNEYASKAASTDVNILFYAGHGLQIEGTNYLIPTNMRADGISVGYVKLNGISLNAVMDYMPASTRLIFLDACRDNPASRSLVATRGAGSVGLAPVSASTGTLIAYATKEGTVAADGNGTNSPYTTALLRHLDAPLDIGIVLRRVRQTVLQMTSNTQEPWEYGSLIGDQLILSQMAR